MVQMTASSINIGPSTTISSLTDIMRENNNKVSESLKKVDQHVDQLEEDIEFFNKERIEQQLKIDSLVTKICVQETVINNLKSEIDALKSYTGWLERNINELRDKIDLIKITGD